MKKITILTTVVMFLLISLGIITNNIANTVEDQKKEIPPLDTKKATIIKVSIKGDTDPAKLNITPNEVVVEKNTIVIWVNFIEGPEINITFSDAKATSAATTDLKSFYIDDDGVFSAKYMPFIATCSVRFLQSGEFSYSITSSDGKESVIGKVIVK